MKLDSLRELFIAELQDTYDAENQVVKALPKIMENASHSELRDALNLHLNQTREQVRRLERCFAALDMKPKSEHCHGMEGILKEGDHLMKKGGDPSAIDAGIIGSAQKVEHYEICSYGTMCTYAEMLGEDECLSLLKQTLSEEKDTDKKLTALAERIVNVDAIRTAGGGISREL
jgi:ferritin-like metal-binding protein YciE